MAEENQTPPGASNVQPAKKPKESPDPAAKRSPREHAKAIGAYKERQLRRGDVAVTSLNAQSVALEHYSWQHNAAAALHGWLEHEHHEGKPIELSLDDYKKAL